VRSQGSTAVLCRWLHLQLEKLPLIRCPFNIGQLPENGIYFFYEDGESCSHDVGLRIVRVGTHKDGNFRSRIAEHFLINQNKMNFDAAKSAPHDRSIFRKNIGRALLNRDGDSYLRVWDIDFLTAAARQKSGHLRNIGKERRVEAEVTEVLRRTFSFRWVVFEGQTQRMGSTGLESALIGTLAQCHVCGPSQGWLGNHSPVGRIRESGLWLFQHLSSEPMTVEQCEVLAKAVERTAQGA